MNRGHKYEKKTCKSALRTCCAERERAMLQSNMCASDTCAFFSRNACVKAVMGHKYTLLCFVLTAFFVLGSMVGMDYILQIRERILLQESGTAEVESPVVTWQEPESDEKSESDAVEEENKRITMEQMEQVISYRTYATDEVLHDPVAGQISMEDAINAGERWLMEMGYAQEEEIQALNRRAYLGIKIYQGLSVVSVEPYYSFWTVNYLGKSMDASLLINAVTGRVWDADIILYNDTSHGFSWEKMEQFAVLAGVEADTENFVEISHSAVETQAFLQIRDSQLCVQSKYYDSMVVVDHNGNAASTGTDVEYYGKNAVISKAAEFEDEEDVYARKVFMFHLIFADEE